jgi:competence protein ComFC
MHQSLLRREERKGHQAEKTEEERKEAMKESPFSVKGGVSGLRIVIVDDVWTTGSTLKAAERTLREGGAESVRFLTVAKG